MKMSIIVKYLCALLLGIVAALEPTIKFAVVLLFAILIDCLSAYDLSRRLKKQHPDKVVGKFQSRFALKMFITFGQAYSVVLLLHMVDVIILHNFGYLNLSNIGAAVFCGVQIWSILENASSGNGARWAKVLQKIMVDKTKRHFDIDLEQGTRQSRKKTKKMKATIITLLISLCLFAGCRTVKNTATTDTEQKTTQNCTDSTVHRVEQTVVPITVKADAATFTIPLDVIGQLPAGAQFSNKSGRATAILEKTHGGDIIVIAHCDSLQLLLNQTRETFEHYQNVATDSINRLNRSITTTKELSSWDVFWIKTGKILASLATVLVILLIYRVKK